MPGALSAERILGRQGSEGGQGACDWREEKTRGKAPNCVFLKTKQSWRGGIRTIHFGIPLATCCETEGKEALGKSVSKENLLRRGISSKFRD